MKKIALFVCAWCLMMGTYAQESTTHLSWEDQKPYSREKPEVYAVRVWNDPFLPFEDFYKMLFVVDSNELHKNYLVTQENIEKLIQTISFYEGGKYSEAISTCEDILATEDNDQIIIKSHFMLGSSLLRRDKDGDCPKALVHFKMALNLVLSQPEPSFEMAGRITSNMGHSIATEWKYHKEAISCWEQSIEYFSKANIEKPHPYYFIAALSPDKAPQYLDLALRIITANEGGNPSLERAACYMHYGWYHWHFGNFDNSFQYFSKAADIYVSLYGEDHPYLISPYLDIAWCYYYPNYPDLALLYSRKALDLALEHLDTNDHRLGTIYNTMGLCYMIQGANERAIEYFEKRLSMDCPNDHSNYLMMTRTLNNIAICHIKKGNYEEAIHLIKKAIKLSDSRFYNVVNGMNTWRDSWYINLGHAYQQNSDYSLALKSLDIALTTFIAWGGRCKTHIAGIFCEKAICFVKNNDLEMAILAYNEALASLGCESLNAVLLGSEFMRDWTRLFTLNGKAGIYQDLWSQTQKEANLDSALSSYHLAITLIDDMQQDFRKSGSKFRMAHILSDVQAIYEGAISCHIEKYKLTGEMDHIERAFTLAEKSKAILLLESVQASRPDRSSNVPDSLSQKENQLKKEIADLRHKIFKEEQRGIITDPLNPRSLHSDLFDLWQEFEKLIRYLETKYPVTQSKRSDIDVLSISDVQDLLQPGQVLVEYFEGYGSIYVFVVSKDTLFVKEIPVDFPLEEWVESLRSGMYDYFVAKDLSGKVSQHIEINAYTKSAYGLYQKLIEPLGPLPEDLIIIPDGILGYIPFEVLLYSQIKNDQINGSYDFLIQKHQISYNYSATLWQEMHSRQYSSSGVLAFAPSFESNGEYYSTVSEVRGEALGSLTYNDDEVQSIHRMMKGKALYSQDATAVNFRALASDYNILHLSTHAKLNDQHPDYSFLAFTDAEGVEMNERLYVSELYNMRLPADMVVLSACETGIGKLQRGEGILSFARAFSSAGAKSIITSLWKANDKATFEIMHSFYKNLKDGLTKSEALRMAKLDYLSSHKGEELHPFYWATFIPMGDMAPLDIGQDHNVLLWFLIPLVLLFPGYLIYRKRVA